MLTKQKLAPTNKIVDAIYDKYILPERKFERKIVKTGGLSGNGKLKESDIDMIRYLTLIGLPHQPIASFYGVSKATISRIRSQDLFDKHISPFEVVDKYSMKHVDKSKLNDWVELNYFTIEKIKLEISKI